LKTLPFSLSAVTGFLRVAATEVLSEQKEAAERAAVALEYTQAVPMDKCADLVLRSSLQEMGFR
jgi:hypothetical protein